MKCQLNKESFYFTKKKMTFSLCEVKANFKVNESQKRYLLIDDTKSTEHKKWIEVWLLWSNTSSCQSLTIVQTKEPRSKKKKNDVASIL